MRYRLGLAALFSAFVGLLPQSAHAEPVGDPSDWTWLRTTDEATPRWDPCNAITWSTPADGSTLERAMVRAIGKLDRLSGYDFTRVPEGGQITAQVVPSNDPMLVFLTAAAYTDVQADWRVDALWFNSADIKIDVVYTVNTRATSINEYRVYTLPIVMHELGHAMGLGHAANQDESMMSGPSVRRYGLGDRQGFAAAYPATCAGPSTLSRGKGVREIVA